MAKAGPAFGPGPIEPVRLSARVRRSQPDAFALFTDRMTDRWPSDRFTFAPGRSHEVLIEPRVGGRFYERYRDFEFESLRVASG